MKKWLLPLFLKRAFWAYRTVSTGVRFAEHRFLWGGGGSHYAPPDWADWAFHLPRPLIPLSLLTCAKTRLLCSRIPSGDGWGGDRKGGGGCETTWCRGFCFMSRDLLVLTQGCVQLQTLFFSDLGMCPITDPLVLTLGCVQSQNLWF